MPCEILATHAHAYAEALTEMLVDVGLLDPAAEVVVTPDGDGAATILVPGCGGTLHASTTTDGHTVFSYAVPALDAAMEEGEAELPNGATIALPVLRLAASDPVLAAHEAVGLITYFNTVELLAR